MLCISNQEELKLSPNAVVVSYERLLWFDPNEVVVVEDLGLRRHCVEYTELHFGTVLNKMTQKCTCKTSSFLNNFVIRSD